MSSPIRLSDEQIIEGIIEGGRAENRAIEALYRQNRSLMLKFISHKTSREFAKEPEDILWEAMEALVNNIKEGKFIQQNTSSLEAYFKTICKNLLLKNITSEVARENRQDIFVSFDAEFEPDVSELLADKEVWDYYLSIFDKAGKNCKEILKMTFADDMPVREVAEQLIADGKYENEQVVRNAKSKCLKRVTELL
jgi:RNA polymerase sigma factor (sigma-70 family)